MYCIAFCEPAVKLRAKYRSGRCECTAEDKIQAGRQLSELGLLLCQLALTLAGDVVISSLPAGLVCLPLAFDEFFRLQIVKQRVQRSFAEGQDVAASLLDGLAKLVAIHWAARKNLQNDRRGDSLQ